jgi:hypothetical protein
LFKTFSICHLGYCFWANKKFRVKSRSKENTKSDYGAKCFDGRSIYSEKATKI